MLVVVRIFSWRKKTAQLAATDHSAPDTEGATSSNSDLRQVFWLTDHPTSRTFSACQPVARFKTTTSCEWHVAAFVPDHSGGSTVDLHHLPCCVRESTDTGDRDRFNCQTAIETHT